MVEAQGQSSVLCSVFQLLLVFIPSCLPIAEISTDAIVEQKHRNTCSPHHHQHSSTPQTLRHCTNAISNYYDLFDTCAAVLLQYYPRNTPVRTEIGRCRTYRPSSAASD